MVPDRRKRTTKFPLGEDAYFIHRGKAFGVADGVGSWAEQSIDSGKFSRELTRRTEEYLENNLSTTDPLPAMLYAEEFAKQHRGSCTFCTLLLDGAHLKSLLLGDSGFVVLRRDLYDMSSLNDPSHARKSRICLENECLLHTRTPGGGWKVVYKSQEQHHAFNTPFQIGSDTTGVTSRNAVSMTIPLKQGDIVVCGTDGLFDNLFINDVCQLVGKYFEQHPAFKACRHTTEGEHNKEATKLAEFITHAAVTASLHPGKRSPFSTQCVKAGYEAHGGKGDDITTVVALVACEKSTPI